MNRGAEQGKSVHGMKDENFTPDMKSRQELSLR